MKKVSIELTPKRERELGAIASIYGKSPRDTLLELIDFTYSDMWERAHAMSKSPFPGDRRQARKHYRILEKSRAA
jgi:hypothetical protein